jgi:demethylmenaquinone methyltransferase / 2-methoxy-6-polyprenyl-1,4-benzoquinol methylase
MPPRSAPTEAPDLVHFGESKVRPAEKDRLVRDVFHRVARRYDLMNDLMSLGVHRAWKNTLIDWLDPQPGRRYLDVAGGTGDIARRIGERIRARGAPAIVVCDISADMLAIGRAASSGAGASQIGWVRGNAEQLPIRTGSIDCYTVAFGLRNVTRLGAALAEAKRVLAPGGRFLCLEFSRVAVPLLDRGYRLWSDRVISALGAAVAGDRAAYVYLVESIRRFPSQESFAGMLTAAGLERVRVRNLSGGIAALHSAWRL